MTIKSAALKKPAGKDPASKKPKIQADAAPKAGKKAKVKSVSKIGAWQDYPLDTYRAVTSTLGHFQSKASKASIPAQRVRIPANLVTNDPYVAVTSIGSSDLPLDGSIMSDYFIEEEFKGLPLCDLYQQVMNVLGDRVTEVYGPNVPAEQIQMVKQAAQECLAKGPAFIGDDALDYRHKQLLFPVDDTYVALTPLDCPGFTNKIFRLFEAEKAQGFKRKYMALDRSNRQNLSHQLNNSRQRVPVFVSVKENPDIREAFYWHYNIDSGFLSMNRFDAMRIHALRADLADKLAHKPLASINAKDRSVLQGLIRRGTQNFIKRVEDVRASLEKLELDSLISKASSVPSHVAALIDPARRYPGWIPEVAEQVLLNLLNVKPRDGEKFTPLSFTEAKTYSKVVESVLREAA